MIARLSSEHFQKHLFERSGQLNGEETEFAMRLDVLDNVLWWFRNREKEDFYLQGWRPGKFYPDFIIKTKSGAYILAEYKGGDRLSNDDTSYKEELGQLWEKLKPMPPDIFAYKAINSVAKNKAIIIIPLWWKLFWWIDRLFPSLGINLARKNFQKMQKQLGIVGKY